MFKKYFSDGLIPPTWLEITGSEGKRADVVEGIYTVRAKPLGKRTSYQKVADYEIPVVLWYNSERSSWTISIFQTLYEARKSRNILAMVNDTSELPHKISQTWHVVEHDSSMVVACSQMTIRKTDPVLIRVYGRRGANAHRINGTFVQREETLGGKYSFRRTTDDGEEIILWYYKRKKCWMISWKGHVGTQNAYAVCKGMGELPSDLDGGTWFVWISKKQSFDTDNNMRVKLGGIRTKMDELDLAADSSSSSPQHTSPASVEYDNSPTRENLNESLIRFPPPVTPDMLVHVGSNSPQVFRPLSSLNWDNDANNDSISEPSEKGTIFASMKDLTMNASVEKRSPRPNISHLRRASVEIRLDAGFETDEIAKAADSVWSTEYLALTEQRNVKRTLVDGWH